MVKPETLTDDQIRESWSTLPNSFTGRDLMIALGEPHPSGDYPASDEIIAARRRICDAINARAAARCPGRGHRRHVLAACEGTCCTSCGGPIDEDGGCRCEG